MSGPGYRALFDLLGKTAFDTGAAGYLGEAFCDAYAECGANLALVDIDGEGAVHTAAAMARRHGVEARGFACDVADGDQVRRVAAEARAAFGRVDILHNNAANQFSGLEDQFAPFEEYQVADWERVMSVDVRGMFQVAQAVGGAMAADGKGGAILQTSSIYGAFGSDNRIYSGAEIDGGKIGNPAVYSTGKAAVLGLTRWLATYWAEAGIRANALVPGGIEANQPEDFKQRYSRRVPLARMGLRHEVAAAAVFLASDAASYITGQSLFVDGGLSAW